MKRILSLMFFLTGINLVSAAQADQNALLKETGEKLQLKNYNVSTVLSDKKYLSIHPLTEFRDSIKKYAAVNILTIAPPDEPGKKIIVKGTINDKNGQPLAGALVYVYQTDSRGWYAAGQPHVGGNEGDRRHARLFGYVVTDKNGIFELHTIKPSGYPQSDLPAHIHIEVNKPGYPGILISEMLFDDDDRLKNEIRARALREGFIIAKPETSPMPFIQLFRYTLHF